MTTWELQAVRALSGATMLPGSWNKRFVRSLVTSLPLKALSDRQRVILWKLVHHYRRQLSPDVIYMGKAHLAALTEWEQVADPEQQVWEKVLCFNPRDWGARLAYSDWLVERNDPLWRAQRWMGGHKHGPTLVLCGTFFCLWMWSFGEASGIKPPHFSRCAAEASLAEHLAGVTV